MRRLAWLAGLGLLGAAHGASAQGTASLGIDCSKARSATEKAICANPGLLALDRQSATAYADALARQPDRADVLRADLLRWLKARDAACALPARAVPDCLRAQITARIAALAPPPAARTATALPAAIPSPPPAGRTFVTDAPLPVPPDPAIPAVYLPVAAATLDQATLPASPAGETLLRVTAPGRFAIAARSPSGTALQLVDMLAGPGEVSGIAGSQDGRIDALLDVGTYKLRVMTAEKATGSVALAVTPFRDAAPPRALPQGGRMVADTLRDGEQRAFWFAVPAGGTVRLEAAGRSLADLRLWRDGRDLVAIDTGITATEPVPGHGLTDARIQGRLEPGTYLLVAYGGEAARWTDNDPSQPFLLRAGASDALAAGWAGGTMGPFGSEVYVVPVAAALLRLRLPAPAEAELVAQGRATIDRRSREPVATLAVTPGRQSLVEVRAAAGQAFTLRALEQPSSVATGRGTFWVSAVANGTGGDEVPPTVVLERADNSRNAPRIVADTLPRLVPGAWRTRFNIRGRTSLAVQANGPVAVQTTGAPVDVRQGGVADLPAGYYALNVVPQPGVQGAVELVAGPPGVVPPPAQAMPPDPVLPLGTQPLTWGERLVLSGVEAPGVSLGLSARPAPVALAEGPLPVSLAAGAGIDVPVRLAPGAVLSVTEVGQGPVPYAKADGAGGGITVTLPPADHPRTVVLAARTVPSPPPSIPAPPPLAAVPTVQAGTPSFFDLERDRERTFSLQVAEGGLLRVETLGRLHTAGRLGNAFIPGFAEADANGIGQNMLIQKVLRAGRYRVAVRAQDSTGHAGFLASPAPLLSPGTLLPGGSVRATLPAGSGAAIPMVLDTAQTVHLDVASLGDPWTGRLEDADGWPLTKPGPLDGIEQKLPAGRYRLLVEPAATARQVVARLRTVPPPAPPITGHGPHPLPFGTPQDATWREPDSQAAPRTPDTWVFNLAGAADVTVTLPDTMLGTLKRDGEEGAGRRVFKSWHGRLDAGAYRLEVTALGRNDRAPYTVSLNSDQVQPGVPRPVTLPATVPFAIAAPRVVSLTTWGTLPVKAVLRRADGTVVGRFRARTDDWNIAVSRPLPAGQYKLELAAADAPATSDVTASDAPGAVRDSSGDNNSSPNNDASNDASSGSDSSSDNGSSPDSDAPPPDDQVAQTAASQSSGDKPASTRASSDDSSDSDAPGPTVEVRLALPEAAEPVPAPAQAAALPGAGVHVLAVEAPPAGTLLVAGAQSAAPLVLALERRRGDAWDVVALDEGRTPIVAAPADGEAQPWRVEAWAVDGGPEPVQAAVRAVAMDEQAPGEVTLRAVDGMPAALAAAHVRLAQPGLLAVSGAAGEVRAGGWPGHPLLPLSGGAVPPLGQDVWLLGPEGPVTAAPLQPAPGQGVALTVPAGLLATLPAVPVEDGAVRLWRARSGTGQPSLGAAMGYAPNGAVALAGPSVPLRAADGDTLRLVLQQDRLALQPTQAVDAAFHATLPPGTALPVTLPPGNKTVDAALPPDTAAIPDWHDPHVAAWAGENAVTRTMAGSWTTMLLVNVGTEPAPVGLSIAPSPPTAAMQPGTVLKRFFGAGGSFELPVAGVPGARIRTAGPATLAVIGADGTVATGTDAPVSGPGRVVVTHEAGAVAVWVDGEGASPWPQPAAQPAAVPSRVALAGAAMAFAVRADAPMLLHVTTTAPVLLALAQPGRTDPPTLFPSGAELHRMVPAGTAELRAYSATDGPLSGTLELRAEPVLPVAEGLGPSVSVPPGGAAAFGFTATRAGAVGIGVQTDVEGTTARLLDGSGRVVGEGVAMLVSLQPGRYVLEAAVPPGSGTAVLRPAVVGIAPRPNGPPPDVVQGYLELVGMKPQGTAR